MSKLWIFDKISVKPMFSKFDAVNILIYKGVKLRRQNVKHFAKK